MSSSNKIKRKLKKLEHVLLKETGIKTVPEPTMHLALLNAGLVNGLSEDIIFENFGKYGIIKNIILLPGKSCCFISYAEVNSATEALKNNNGKLNIAQDNKPIYISYVRCLPSIKSKKMWNKLPPGLIIIENFISDEEEIALLKEYDLEENEMLGNNMKHRQVKHYGYEFRYDINNVNKDSPMNEKVPSKFNVLWEKLKEIHNINFYPDQLTINKYNPGQGIPHHIDTHSAFEDPIVSLSLQSSVIMDFKKDDEHLCILLPRKSLAIISGESRYDWTHGITPRKFDIVLSQNGYTCLERGIRISLTFRKIRRGECDCNYKTKCDSYNKTNQPKIENIASELEKKHVHEVYENIASHFSDTRHKPWPNVLKFVQTFQTGSILVDIGCGNGKYLSQNKNIFDIGCDQSVGLINVCRERGFEVFSGNCLNVPIKDNIADGVISIAVIHHLANEERRLSSINEIIRILRKGGHALIYVWAKDQFKDKEKSSYIKQDRKNRKVVEDTIVENLGSSEEASVLEGVTLPIHTNRTQFQHSDLLVPWKLKNKNENNNTFLRFYHVFERNELENLCKKLADVEIIESYYDQGNWCVIIKKS